MNARPLLTIGMAHYEDFAGLWQTIQSIRLNNSKLMERTQFVVVNNSPENKQTGEAIRNLLGQTAQPGQQWGPKYFELSNVKGTSASRNAIFDHADGEYVLVIDCHLELHPQALRLLMEYYAAHPDTKDILSGPLLSDSFRSFSTHYRDTWDDGMWGQWAQAWQCSCGPDGSHFDLQRKVFESGTALAVPCKLQLGNVPISHCEACGKEIGEFVWEGHEGKYESRGFVRAGITPGPAFEIPGQGLGFFSCRKDAWLGFTPHARAFGAEELCIHEKFRKAGHKALCIPGVLWSHRFYREGGAKYPNTNYDKCRNYVLWYQELGLPLDPIRQHFVETPVRRYLEAVPPETRYFVSPEAWDDLIADPINATEDRSAQRKTLEQAAALLPELTTIDALFDQVYSIPRDLNEHMPALRSLTDLAGGTVVELTGRRESTIAFLAGAPQSLTSYTTELDNHCWKAAALVRESTRYTPRQFQMGTVITDIPDNDLLFVDTIHTYAVLSAELTAYAPHCRRFIAIHDTEVYGTNGEDRGLGLRQAIAEFCHNNPEWSVIDHVTLQYGMTVLSRNPDDRPAEPVAGFSPPEGPGTELKTILHSLGINPAPSCGCNAKAAQMDAWGIDGCEQSENFQTIVGWLRDGTWTSLDLMSAAYKSVWTGLAWEINPLHPFESLVKLCIKRARETRDKNQKRAA